MTRFVGTNLNCEKFFLPLIYILINEWMINSFLFLSKFFNNHYSLFMVTACSWHDSDVAFYWKRKIDRHSMEARVLSSFFVTFFLSLLIVTVIVFWVFTIKRIILTQTSTIKTSELFYLYFQFSTIFSCTHILIFLHYLFFSAFSSFPHFNIIMSVSSLNRLFVPSIFILFSCKRFFHKL